MLRGLEGLLHARLLISKAWALAQLQVVNDSMMASIGDSLCIRFANRNYVGSEAHALIGYLLEWDCAWKQRCLQTIDRKLDWNGLNIHQKSSETAPLCFPSCLLLVAPCCRAQTLGLTASYPLFRTRGLVHSNCDTEVCPGMGRI